MAYGQWRVNENLTFDEFGYYSSELSSGSTKPVKCTCEECGVTANKRIRESNLRHVCKSIIDGKKKCFKCKTFKLVDEFSKNKSTFDGYSKVCKDCFSNYDSVKKGYKKKTNLIKTDIKSYFHYKTNFLKTKCKLKGLSFDLDVDFLYNLYVNQNGKCYYSGIDIIHNSGCSNFDSISVERLIPERGYTKDNVVLASFSLNSFKGMMNEVEFKKFLKQIIPNLLNYSIKVSK